MEFGRIFVNVQIEDGAGLPGAVGTVMSPSLLGERSEVSNANGEMRFLELPPGEYELTVTFTGFQTFKREDIPVRLGQDTRVEVTLQVANVEETLAVQPPPETPPNPT